MEVVIVILLPFLLFTIALAYVDAEKIEANEYINHNTRTLVRIAFFAVNTSYIECTLPERIALMLLQSALFWILFDIAINKFRKLPLFYIGKTAMIDKFFGRFAPVVMLLAKVVYLLVTILVVLYI